MRISDWSSDVCSSDLGLLAFWHLFQERAKIVKGTYFQPFDFSNWFNLACFVAGGLFLWLIAHRVYVASFGVSLKSISLKDIQIAPRAATEERSEEHTSELQSLMRISYAVFCLKKKKKITKNTTKHTKHD